MGRSRSETDQYAAFERVLTNEKPWNRNWQIVSEWNMTNMQTPCENWPIGSRGSEYVPCLYLPCCVYQTDRSAPGPQWSASLDNPPPPWLDLASTSLDRNICEKLSVFDYRSTICKILTKIAVSKTLAKYFANSQNIINILRINFRWHPPFGKYELLIFISFVIGGGWTRFSNIP